jgi:CDP-diacylglycerol--glycerol-3-phosphate 3-phosphatidyltransferase
MILPNQLTVLRIILTPVFFLLFISGVPWMMQVSVIVYLIAAITDWYDGWLARKFNYITNWGKFLDPLADKILTSTAFLAFVLVGLVNLWLALLIILRDILVTLLRLYADSKGYSFTTSLTAKVKTFFQMVFIYYLLFAYSLRSVDYIGEKYSTLFDALLNKELIWYLMIAVTLLTLGTGIGYVIRNKNLIKKLFEFEAE